MPMEITLTKGLSEPYSPKNQGFSLNDFQATQTDGTAKILGLRNVWP